jgi:hypothetical protein
MKMIVYVECGSLDTLDNLLGQGVDDNTVEKYAVLTIDGAPLVYEAGQDSAHDYLNEMSLKCMGVTA